MLGRQRCGASPVDAGDNVIVVGKFDKFVLWSLHICFSDNMIDARRISPVCLAVVFSPNSTKLSQPNDGVSKHRLNAYFAYSLIISH